jgi:hypothetical protein
MATVNSAAINMGKHVSLMYDDVDSFGYIPRSGISRSMIVLTVCYVWAGGLCFTVLKNESKQSKKVYHKKKGNKQNSHSWEGSQERVAAGCCCLVVYIVASKKFQTKTLSWLAGNHSNCLLGPTRYLHTLFMRFLPYQVSNRKLYNG